MALSDLAVYSEYVYTAMTEVLDQQINLFNAASDGTIVLQPAAHQGDFSDEVMFQKIAGGTVRRRNAYGTGAIAQKTIKHLVDTSVKVAAGTQEFLFEPSNFKWIQRNPEEAGVAMGQQMAVDALADMLNTGLGCVVSAMDQKAAITYDITAYDPTAKESDVPTFISLTKAAGKLGDRSSAVRCWVMHSTALTNLYVNALQNVERLFVYGNINVNRDPFGRLFVQTDSTNLQWSQTTPSVASGFYTLGLQQNGLFIGQNNDFDAMEQMRTGSENLQRTYQAEWSYQVGIQGFSWDKANGGKSPTDAALFTSTNWDQYATSYKDLCGVILKSH